MGGRVSREALEVLGKSSIPCELDANAQELLLKIEHSYEK